MWSIPLVTVLPDSIVSGISNQFFINLINQPFGGLVAYNFGYLTLALALFTFIKTVIEMKKFRPVLECFSYFVFVAICVLWFNFSFFHQQNGLVLLCMGFVVSLLVCKIIISSVTKVTFPLFR